MLFILTKLPIYMYSLDFHGFQNYYNKNMKNSK